MKVITWNLRRASKENPVWDLILKLKPDIVLLQEVGSIPAEITSVFDVLSRVATNKTGDPQKFRTAVLVKGKIIQEINLKSEFDWVNKELEFFKGNFIACNIQLENKENFNVVSVYSPAWTVGKDRLKGIDVSKVKLTSNNEIWASEIIWTALKSANLNNKPWIVGGDYNSSETFDRDYQLNNGGLTGGLISDGNKEIRDRMYALGFKECLREYKGRLMPTFKNISGEIVHQLDHLYVSNKLYTNLKKCTVGEKSVIFDKGLSDHLPIIAEFENK
jgi:exonuclease III